MSFWSSISGSQQRKDASRSTTAANAELARGRTVALEALQRGSTEATANLHGGYSTATGEINTGADRARTALGTGFDTARGDLNAQFGRAENAVTGYLDPWIASGRGAQDLYDTALGTRGTPGDRTAFYENYAQNDPFRAFRDQQAGRQIQSQFNARGQSGSGRFNTAVSRASLERGTTDLNSYLDRLGQQGALGGQYAARAGSELAGLRSNLGTQLGALEQNRGAQVGGLEERTGARLGELGYRFGSDLAGTNNGQAEANLEYGHAQQLAGNRINLGNAFAASRSVLPNLLTNIAGTAIRAATPMGTTGATAFGNLSTGLSNIGTGIGGAIGNRLIPGFPGS